MPLPAKLVRNLESLIAEKIERWNAPCEADVALAAMSRDGDIPDYLKVIFERRRDWVKLEILELRRLRYECGEAPATDSMRPRSYSQNLEDSDLD